MEYLQIALETERKERRSLTERYCESAGITMTKLRGWRDEVRE